MQVIHRHLESPPIVKTTILFFFFFFKKGGNFGQKKKKKEIKIAYRKAREIKNDLLLFWQFFWIVFISENPNFPCGVVS